jgi:hypothetical protein
MISFQGRIEDGNGKTVVDNLAGSLGEGVSARGLKSWSGSFTLPTGKGLQLGDYLLVLDDGRFASILVTSVGASSSGSRVVQFKLTGPPP